MRLRWKKTKDFKKRWKISEKCLKKELSYHKVLQDEIQRERNNVKTVIEKMREMEEALGERVAELEAELAAKAQELVKLGDTLETHQILQLEAMHKGQKDLAVVPALQREVKDLREVGRRQREVVEAVQRENRVLQRALGAASRVAQTGEETLAAYREEASAGLHREVLELRKEIARKNDQIAKWQHKYELAVNKHDEMRKVIFQNGLNPEYTGHQAKLGLGCHTRRNGTNTTGNTFANTECNNNSSNHLSLADAVGRHNASMDRSSSSATFFSGKNKKLGIDYGQTRQTLRQRPTLQAHRRHGKSADQQHFSLLPSLQHQQEGSLNSSKALGLPTTIGSSRQQKIQEKEARRHRQKGQKNAIRRSRLYHEIQQYSS